MQKRRFRLLFAAASSACITTFSAHAQTPQVLPNIRANSEGTTGNSIPIGASAGRYQAVYAASLLSSVGIVKGSVIIGLEIRQRNQATTSWPSALQIISDYEIHFAQSAREPNNLSTTFDTNAIGRVQLRDGELALSPGAYPGTSATGSTPEPWGPYFSLTRGYTYSGGPLLIEFRSSGATDFTFANAELASALQAGVGSVSSPNAGTGNLGGAVVVRLTFVHPTRDLARGITKVILGQGLPSSPGNVSSAALTQQSPLTKVTVIDASHFDALGLGSQIVSASWRRPANAGGSPWPASPLFVTSQSLQLSQSRNPPGALSPLINANVGPDALEVGDLYATIDDGAFLPASSYPTAPFIEQQFFENPYTYRGGPLLTVARHAGQSNEPALPLDAIGPGSPDYNTLVQSLRADSLVATSTTIPDATEITRFGIDAATSSPLNQPSPGADAVGMVNFLPTLQTLIAPSELRHIPIGSVIDSLWLRQIASAPLAPTAGIACDDFEIYLSTSPREPRNMSELFAANEGADRVQTYDGPLGIPAGTFPPGSIGTFGKFAQFQKHFVYRGGPLCVTLRHWAFSGSLGAPEALIGTEETNRTVFDRFKDGDAGDFFTFSGYSGMALQFGYIPSIMTPNSLATTEGVSGLGLPSQSQYVAQVIIQAAQLRALTVGSTITGLSLRNSSSAQLPSFPSFATLVSRFDITLSPAAHPPLEASNVFANNIAPGAVLVREGLWMVLTDSFPASGSPTEPAQNASYLEFARPYTYTGGDLCITIRSFGAIVPIGIFDTDGSAPSSRGTTKYALGNTEALTATSTTGPLAIRLAFTPRTPCPCDLNNDGIVADEDFPTFIFSYNVLLCEDQNMPQSCAADFTLDGSVDDADFEVFVAAYSNLVCP